MQLSKKKPLRPEQINQLLIRNPKTIKKTPYSYLNFIEYFFKNIVNSSNPKLTQKSLFLFCGFLTEHGQIRSRTERYDMSIKKYKLISKLIKKAREFRIIPSVFKVLL